MKKRMLALAAAMAMTTMMAAVPVIADDTTEYKVGICNYVDDASLNQIVDKRYTEGLEQDGIHKILKYGIACYKKTCKVVLKIEE